MRLDQLPAVRHGQVADAIGLDDTAQLFQVLALRVSVADVFDDVITDDDIEVAVRKWKAHVLSTRLKR